MIKFLLLVFIMIDLVDLFHYFIGLVIVSFLIWVIIKAHVYFSKDNVPITSAYNTNHKQ
jgi:hypothetical protein